MQLIAFAHMFHSFCCVLHQSKRMLPIFLIGIQISALKLSGRSTTHNLTPNPKSQNRFLIVVIKRTTSTLIPSPKVRLKSLL